MIGFLAFVLAASAPPPPVPSPEQQPFYLVDFTVTLDGDTIVEGSKEVRTGVYSTETRTRIFPPACDKGAVEFGYRKITLYVRENGQRTLPDVGSARGDCSRDTGCNEHLGIEIKLPLGN